MRGKRGGKCAFPIVNHHLRAASTRLEATLMALTPIAWECANRNGKGGRNKRKGLPKIKSKLVSTVLKSVPILDLLKLHYYK